MDLSGLTLPVVAVAAAIDSLNPCAFSVLLLTIGFLLSMGRDRRNIVAVGGTYIAGIFVMYVLIGLGIMRALAVLGTPHFMAKAGAVALIVFAGINLLGTIFPNFPIRLKIPRAAHRTIAVLMERASFPAAFVLGLFVGLTEFPCTGGPYLLVLGLLHDRATWLQGVGYLLFYNLIFILPLIVILAAGSDKMVLERIAAWKKRGTGGARYAESVALIVLGALIFFFS